VFFFPHEFYLSIIFPVFLLMYDMLLHSYNCNIGNERNMKHLAWQPQREYVCGSLKCINNVATPTTNTTWNMGKKLFHLQIHGLHYHCKWKHQDFLFYITRYGKKSFHLLFKYITTIRKVLFLSRLQYVSMAKRSYPMSMLQSSVPQLFGKNMQFP